MIPKRLLPDVRLKKTDIPDIHVCGEYYEWQYAIDTRIEENDTIGSKFLSGKHGAIPIGPTTSHPVTVNWGDGTIEVIETLTNGKEQSSDSPENYTGTRGLIHEYASGGKYVITVGCDHWHTSNLAGNLFGNFPSSRDITDSQIGYLSNCIFRATLIRVLKPLPIINTYISGNYSTSRLYGQTTVRTWSDVDGSTVYPLEDTHPIGENYKKYEAGNDFMIFYRAYRLKSVPENLFKAYETFTWEEWYPSATRTDCNKPIFSLNEFFYGCKALKTIPKNLLKPCKYLNSCFGMFAESGLHNIPSNFFKNNLNLINVAGCFQNCENLRSVPYELFKNNLRLQNISYAFRGCYNLFAIPSDLFAYSDYLRFANEPFTWSNSGELLFTGTSQLWAIKSPHLKTFSIPLSGRTQITASDGSVQEMTIYACDAFTFSVPERSRTQFTLIDTVLAVEYRVGNPTLKDYFSFWNTRGLVAGLKSKEGIPKKLTRYVDLYGSATIFNSYSGVWLYYDIVVGGAPYYDFLETNFPSEMKLLYDMDVVGAGEGLNHIMCLEKGWSVNGYKKIIVNNSYYCKKTNSSGNGTLWETYVKNYLGENSTAYAEYLGLGGQLTPPTNP